LYLHSEPPNSHYPDLARYCAVGTNDQSAPCDLISSPPWQGAHKLAARSAHPGGINLVMLDGSTHFMSNDVDSTPHGKDTPGVWQALSTYSGSETVVSP
jgi:prepilin-type processing-associated H-X9-DG protein